MQVGKETSTTLHEPRGYRAYVMTMLVAVYTFNFIDRQIISILAVPIKADLGLSDTQLGLMAGLAFALFYTALGIPIAMWADRGHRVGIMTLALAVWSAMTALCGLAQNFWQLFFARMGVGVGEAGGVAPAHSLISDYFPSDERARALGIYAFGIPIGSALGIVLGGLVASKVDWRFAFFAVGIAGVLFAPLFRATVKEPMRGRYDSASKLPPASFKAFIAKIKGKSSFWLMAAGASCSSMAGYGFFFWLPSFFVRSFGLSLLEASLYYGAILLVGGLAGIWLGGVLADRFGKSRRAAYLLVPAVAFLLTIPFYALAILSTDLTLAFFFFLVPTALGLAWLGPIISAIQHVVPPTMRATASAVFLFIINLLGLGLGTVILGALSDHLTQTFANEALRYSILAGTSFYLAAAMFCLLGARRLGQDWE